MASFWTDCICGGASFLQCLVTKEIFFPTIAQHLTCFFFLSFIWIWRKKNRNEETKNVNHTNAFFSAADDISHNFNLADCGFGDPTLHLYLSSRSNKTFLYHRNRCEGWVHFFLWLASNRANKTYRYSGLISKPFRQNHGIGHLFRRKHCIVHLFRRNHCIVQCSSIQV